MLLLILDKRMYRVSSGHSLIRAQTNNRKTSITSQAKETNSKSIITLIIIYNTMRIAQ